MKVANLNCIPPVYGILTIFDKCRIGITVSNPIPNPTIPLNINFLNLFHEGVVKNIIMRVSAPTMDVVKLVINIPATDTVIKYHFVSSMIAMTPIRMNDVASSCGNELTTPRPVNTRTDVIRSDVK